jgi:hypothetical protein
MKIFYYALALTILALSTWAAVLSSDCTTTYSNPADATAGCLSNGNSATVNCARPDIQAGGHGGNCEWAGDSADGDDNNNNGSGNPRLMEDDTTSPDDPMGHASTTDNGQHASGTVTNSGGSLSGSSGGVQNGGWEGDCIEVKVCWYYWYEVQISQTSTHGGSVAVKPGISVGGEHSTTTTVTKWRLGEVCSSTTEICPCP